MNEDEIARRKTLTFAKAEGAALLPRQLQCTELSPELRAVLWRFIFSELRRNTAGGAWDTFVGKRWRDILEAAHVLHFHLMADEFSAVFGNVSTSLKSIFEKGDYVAVYGWLQFVLRKRPPNNFVNNLQFD